MDINSLMDEIIDVEGGFVNHPADTGGPTKYGITLKTLANHRGEECGLRDVSLLTKDEAREIYLDNYYLAHEIDKLPVDLQPVVFDMAVNMGPRQAIKIMQRVTSGMGFPVYPDGVIGPNTLKSARIAVELFKGNVSKEITKERILFYKQLARERPSQMAFLNGWINRAERFA